MMAYGSFTIQLRLCYCTKEYRPFAFWNSAFIDNKALFFRYKASLLIEKHGSNIDETTRQEILAVRYADKEQLDAMALELGLDFGAFLETEKPYLSSDQIEELIKRASILAHIVSTTLNIGF
ncbi:MAG: hypothetical protein R2778_14860 [Saprospiraceae bacterium]